MSLNRELVVFYITYKLSQRNFPLDHLGLRGGVRTEEGVETGLRGGVRTEEGAGPRGGVRTESEEGSDAHTNGSVNGGGELTDAPVAPPLPRSHSSPNPTPPPSAASAPPPALDLEAVKEALQDSANEFELRFSRAFSDLHRQLHITPATAYRSFESVMDEVFRDGVNWGRVVGLFAFGGALCVECVEKEMSPLVARIAEWMTLYLDNHIQDWITAQGGWARFSEIYGQDAAAESRRSQESLKKWLWAGMTLVTGVVVGSLIAQKRL